MKANCIREYVAADPSISPSGRPLIGAKQFLVNKITLERYHFSRIGLEKSHDALTSLLDLVNFLYK